jgi:hypothetical protein
MSQVFLDHSINKTIIPHLNIKKDTLNSNVITAEGLKDTVLISGQSQRRKQSR